MIRFLFVSCLIPALALATPVNHSLESRFGARIRTRDITNCKIILSPKDQFGRTDNSTGYALANLDAEDFSRSLNQLLATIDRSELAGDLAVTGLPLWDEWSQDLVTEIKRTLTEAGLDSQIRMIPMYQPKGRGLKGALERLRALLPMRQDWERPIAEELRVGMPAVLGAELTTLIYALSAFPPEVSVPMAVGHLGLLGTLASLRRTHSNWMARSSHQWEGLAKVLSVGTMFVINFNLSSHWPEIAQGLEHHGLRSYLAHNVLPGLSHFMTTQGVTTATQTLFFWVTFTNGVFRWEAMMTKDPKTSDAARRTAAVISPLIFWISGPLLGWASTSQDILLNLGPVAINPGQAALAGLAAAGSVFWIKPEVLNPTVQIVDRFVYTPLTLLRNYWRQIKTSFWDLFAQTR